MVPSSDFAPNFMENHKDLNLQKKFARPSVQGPPHLAHLTVSLYLLEVRKQCTSKWFFYPGK